MPNRGLPDLESPWPTPSAEVRELIRRGAELALAVPTEWLNELDAIIFPDVEGNPHVDDPVLMAAARRSNRAGLAHWATANLQHPGEPVPPYIPVDMEITVREMARRGMSEQLINSSRTLQNAALRLNMRLVFQLTRDPALLEELLEINARSIGAFFDDNMRAIILLMDAEKRSMQQNSHVERRELVAKILENGKISDSLAKNRLNYAMNQTHCGALIWSETASPELSHLEEAARVLALSFEAQQSLVILASPATLWVWCSASQSLDRHRIALTLRSLPGVRIALGSPGAGIDGFRRSHLEALTVQRVLGRLDAPAAVVSIEEVRLVSLMTQDAKAAHFFVKKTLGDLADAPGPLRATLRAVLQHGCNLSSAANALHTHRNTLVRRLARAESLLPRPLAEYRLDVSAALELLVWMRSTTSEAP